MLTIIRGSSKIIFTPRLFRVVRLGRAGLCFSCLVSIVTGWKVYACNLHWKL